MADISKITLPNGKSYNFKDATARSGLAEKAAASHTHDDRYYTETEMNTKLSQKVDKGGVLHVSRNPTSNGYLKFADITTSQYGNKSILLLVSADYNNGTLKLGNAIAYINIRGNGTGVSSIYSFSWLMKEKNFNIDLYYAVNGHTIEFYRSVNSGQYSQTSFKILNISNFENAVNWTFNLKSVAFVENTPLDTPIGTVVGMTNEGVIEYANNADTVDGKHASDFAGASHTHSSYVNQNAFSNIAVGSTTVSADSATDTLTLVAGSNITITPDAANDKITIASTNTWRGIQNNLTSDSTTDSLSAAQGKVLKGLVDGKASSSHTHSEYASKAKYRDTTINVGRKADTVVGSCSTAEGSNTTASGGYSHAEGSSTTASGQYSHAEGSSTTASAPCSHAEGSNTTASEPCSHAEGMSTVADGKCSHAGGTGTKALHDNEVAYGSYNESYADTLFSIGDGTSDTARHNAFEITTTGGMLHDKDIFTSAHCIQFIPYNMKYYALNDRLLLFANDDTVTRGIYFVNNTPNDIVVCALISATGSGPTVQYGYGTNTYPDIQNTGEGREWFSEESIQTHPTIYTMTVPTGKRGYYGVYRNSETTYTTIHDIRCPYFNYF